MVTMSFELITFPHLHLSFFCQPQNISKNESKIFLSQKKQNLRLVNLRWQCYILRQSSGLSGSGGAYEFNPMFTQKLVFP